MKRSIGEIPPVTKFTRPPGGSPPCAAEPSSRPRRRLDRFARRLSDPAVGRDSRNRRRRRGNPPPRVTVRGRLLDGSRDCYRVDLIEADLDADRLLLRLTTQDDPDWDGGPCSDIGQTHPYDIAVVEFTEAAVPERVEVRHGDETVLEEAV